MQVGLALLGVTECVSGIRETHTFCFRIEVRKVKDDVRNKASLQEAE